MDILAAYDVMAQNMPVWTADQKAADLEISGDGGYAMTAHLRDYLADDRIDCFLIPPENRRKKLLMADMDSTIVTSETLDELAESAGIKDQVAEITARAMNGELDFKEALRERVALLKGLPYTKLQETLEKIELSEGAKALVGTMKKNGATCVLVSGGFTFFASEIARRAGFDASHANTLSLDRSTLSGEVLEPILDKFTKVEFLQNHMKQLGLEAGDCLAIGDGANDIPMLKAAGMAFGYKPKPIVAEEIKNLIIHSDLSAALYAQGYTERDIT